MDFNNLKPIKNDIKVLGPGCKKCKKLEQLTQQAIEELGLDAVIEKVEDMPTIMSYGIMQTPGLVINNKVILTGMVPKLSALKELISEYI
jgi:small redox-active disulfide protein 2